MTLSNDIRGQHATIDAWWRSKSRHMNGKRFRIIETTLTVIVALGFIALAAYAVDLGADATWLPIVAILSAAALLGKGAEVAALLGDAKNIQIGVNDDNDKD